jgi:hypothetical protein
LPYPNVRQLTRRWPRHAYILSASGLREDEGLVFNFLDGKKFQMSKIMHLQNGHCRSREMCGNGSWSNRPGRKPVVRVWPKTNACKGERRGQDAQKDSVFSDHVDYTPRYWLLTIMSQNETAEKTNFSMSR